MVKYLAHEGPFNDGLKLFKKHNTRLASIPEYIEFINNGGIPEDSYDDFVRTKECFIYFLQTNQIDSPKKDLSKPGGIWFNTKSPLILNPNEAVKKHKANTIVRLNGLLKKSLKGAINHLEDIRNIPVNSLERYDIAKKIFGEKLVKYQDILRNLGIKNIHLDFYSKDEIETRGYPFADQALAYLDKQEGRLSITGKSNRLYSHQRTLGIKNNLFRNPIQTLKNCILHL